MLVSVSDIFLTATSSLDISITPLSSSSSEYPKVTFLFLLSSIAFTGDTDTAIAAANAVATTFLPSINIPPSN